MILKQIFNEIILNNRQRKILVWYLAWAGLLLLVLYSPLGSPDSYESKVAFTQNQEAIPINTSGNEISNKMRNTNTNGNDNNPSIDISELNTNLKNSTTYNGYNPQNPISTPNSAYALKESFNSSSKTSQPIGMVTNDGLFFSSTKSGNGINSSQNFGLTSSLSSNLSPTLNNTTNRQLATTDTGSGTDPGGDPGGDPIPVGDGWIYMLFLAGIYSILRMRKVIFIKKNSNLRL
jgi:hypothetical protein